MLLRFVALAVIAVGAPALVSLVANESFEFLLYLALVGGAAAALFPEYFGLREPRPHERADGSDPPARR